MLYIQFLYVLEEIVQISKKIGVNLKNFRDKLQIDHLDYSTNFSINKLQGKLQSHSEVQRFITININL